MDQEWNVVVVGQYPAEGFRQGVEQLWTAFAAESESDCKVITSPPANSEKSPEVWVNGEYFERADNVGFGEP